MWLTPGDLPSTARAAMSEADLAILIQDAEARALLAAPCLNGPISDAQRVQVVAVLRSAIGRVTERATRDDRQMTAGPFTVGSPVGERQSRALFWPTELEELRAICVGGARRGRAKNGWLA